jgi:hypothetical protein
MSESYSYWLGYLAGAVEHFLSEAEVKPLEELADEVAALRRSYELVRREMSS